MHTYVQTIGTEVFAGVGFDFGHRLPSPFPPVYGLGGPMGGVGWELIHRVRRAREDGTGRGGGIRRLPVFLRPNWDNRVPSTDLFWPLIFVRSPVDSMRVRGRLVVCDLVVSHLSAASFRRSPGLGLAFCFWAVLLGRAPG
jgi:hypothetical protein